MRASDVTYRHHQHNLNAAVLGAILLTLFQVWAGRVMPYVLALAAACGVWAAVEWRRRLKFRRHNGARGPLAVHTMLERARRDWANNYLIIGPLCAGLLTALGGFQAGTRGALAGAAGGVLYLLFAILVERYPVTSQPPAA